MQTFQSVESVWSSGPTPRAATTLRDAPCPSKNLLWRDRIQKLGDELNRLFNDVWEDHEGMSSALAC